MESDIFIKNPNLTKIILTVGRVLLGSVIFFSFFKSIIFFQKYLNLKKMLSFCLFEGVKVREDWLSEFVLQRIQV